MNLIPDFFIMLELCFFFSIGHLSGFVGDDDDDDDDFGFYISLNSISVVTIKR